MKKKYFFKAIAIFLIISGFSVSSARAQFDLIIEQATDSAQVVQWIEDIFLDGVNPSQYKNIEFTGDFRAVGHFTSGYIFGFSRSEGIVMSSGLAGDLDKSNDCGPANANNATNGGSDPDLAQLTSLSINDACVIEFDFKPAGDSAKFNFSFGSEEYHDYVGSTFNDVFGFFLSGPGINGPHTNNAINIAMVPGTSLPVTISNVNCGNHAAGCNVTLPGGPNCQYLIDNTNTSMNSYDQFALDAYTQPFVADNEVTPCKWYHIKLAIGDAGDNAFDSGVFLEKGSFDPGNVRKDVEYTHPTVDTLLYESCNNHDAIVYFEIGSTRAAPYIIPFQVMGSATRNVDYEIIGTHPGDSIYIPAGELLDSLRIRTFTDTDVEGIEDVQIIFNSVMCGFGSPDTAFVYIADLPPMPDTAVEFTTICENPVTIGFGNFIGGAPPYSFDWYTINKTTPTVNYTPSGNNYFEIPCLIYDTCGQQVSDTAIVIVPALVADAGPDKSMCNQDSVQLEGSSPGAQHFFWDSNPSDPSLIGKQDSVQPWVYPTVETDYILEASDNCTNVDTDTVHVTLSEAVADAGDDQNICINESTTLTANGGDGFSWLWSASPPDPTLSGQETNQTINVAPTVTTVYTVEVTNDCDFSATDDATVVVTPLPNADAGPDDEICFGESKQLNATGGTHYQWSSVPYDASLYVGGQDTLPNPVVTPPTQEPYKYFVEVWDQCLNNDSMTLLVDPIPDISIQPDQTVLCYGDTVTLQAMGNADFTWSSDPVDPTLAGQENNQTIMVAPLVNTTYTLVGVVSGFDCPATLTQDIQVKPQLVSDFDLQDNLTCQGETFSVVYTGNAAPGATYNWDFDGGQVESGTGQGPIDLKWDTDGVKTISLYVNDDGCLSQPLSKDVEVVKTPLPGFSADAFAGCVPLAVNFTNSSENLTSNVTYQWEFGTGDGSTVTDPAYTYTQPGIYDVTLTVTNEGRCINSFKEPAYIEAYEIPVADFTLFPEQAVLEEATINFTNGSTSNDPMTYNWDFGDNNTSDQKDPVHTYTESGEYTVVLVTTTSNGCENTTEKTVTIHPDLAVYAPNAFTPNGDGLNDFFEVKGLGIKKYKLQIYSRWGELIYESENLEDQWDGTFNGKKVPADTYIYNIYYTSMVDKSSTLKGTVTVMY